MIEVKNLVRRYGNTVAVDHLSFTLESGKIYGFLGPNGAGKSTTMNMMTGYIGATEGTVVINGHDILKEPTEAKKCIGYLPEIPPLYMDMTVEEYLEFVAELKEIPAKKRKEQINTVADRTGVTDVRKRLIRNLSKGYRQRVGIAQAILGDPEIIILDEPTVGLDPRQIIEIRNLIRNGNTPQIANAIATSAAIGGQTMDQALCKLVRSGAIGRDMAIQYAHEPEYVKKNA